MSHELHWPAPHVCYTIIMSKVSCTPVATVGEAVIGRGECSNNVIYNSSWLNVQYIVFYVFVG